MPPSAQDRRHRVTTEAPPAGAKTRANWVIFKQKAKTIPMIEAKDVSVRYIYVQFVAKNVRAYAFLPFFRVLVARFPARDKNPKAPPGHLHSRLRPPAADGRPCQPAHHSPPSFGVLPLPAPPPVPAAAWRWRHLGAAQSDAARQVFDLGPRSKRHLPSAALSTGRDTTRCSRPQPSQDQQDPGPNASRLTSVMG